MNVKSMTEYWQWWCEYLPGNYLRDVKFQLTLLMGQSVIPARGTRSTLHYRSRNIKNCSVQNRQYIKILFICIEWECKYANKNSDWPIKRYQADFFLIGRQSRRNWCMKRVIYELSWQCTWPNKISISDPQRPIINSKHWTKNNENVSQHKRACLEVEHARLEVKFGFIQS